MKIWLFAAAGTMLLAVMSGCHDGIGVKEGFGHAPLGIIYSHGIQGGATEPNLEIIKRPYRHLGRVSGDASQTNILFLFTGGNASIEKAQKDALSKAKGADALINRNFDVSHTPLLGIFTVATLQVSGDAIKFTDNQ